MVHQHLGPDWEKLFLPHDAGLTTRIAGRLKTLAVPRRRKVENMWHDVFAAWKPGCRAMKPFRGMRVRCRYTNHTQIHSAHKNKWYTGRIIGTGNTLGTFEVLFDTGQGEDDEQDDRHLRTPLYLGRRDDDGVGAGAAAIRLPTVEFVWNSPIVD